MYQDLRGEWRWRIVATNGRVMADSAEGYDTHANVIRALNSLTENIAEGGITIDDAA
ncbi:MAG: DUF1508 domain-containing protein [Actinobacteria bacterium]|nr:DUF1508 domain-containing protein [Actinomycetota bacterium]